MFVVSALAIALGIAAFPSTAPSDLLSCGQPDSVAVGTAARGIAAQNRAIAKRPRVITFIGDSSSSPLYSPPGFPALVSRAVGLPIHNLAIVSEGRNIGAYDITQAVNEELPRLPADTTDAVVFLGTDDLNGLSYHARTLPEVERAYLTIVNTLKARHIRVHLITVRNFSLDPKYPTANYPPNVAEWQANMQLVTDAFDDWVVQLGYPTLDIRKYQELMDPSSYQDGIHFTNIGLQRITSCISPWFAPARVTRGATGQQERLAP